MNTSTPVRLQFSLQEILAWTAVFALALSLLMIWEFPWLAVLAIGVGGYLVETIGRRRANDVRRFGDWLGLFAGYLLLGSGPYVAMVEGNDPTSWGLPLGLPVAPVLYRIPSWTLGGIRSPAGLAVCVAVSCAAFLVFTGMTIWRPRLRWLCVVLLVTVFALNSVISGY